MVAPLRLFVALASGILCWLVYYRVQVGPFCPAMWFGTAPPVVIGLSSYWVYKALGRVG